MCLLGCQTHGSATWCVSDVAWSRWNRKPLTEAFGISSIWLDCCPDPLSLVWTAYFILKPRGSPVTPRHICVSNFPNSSLLRAILFTQTSKYLMVLKGLGPHVVRLLLWLQENKTFHLNKIVNSWQVWSCQRHRHSSNGGLRLNCQNVTLDSS